MASGKASVVVANNRFEFGRSSGALAGTMKIIRMLALVALIPLQGCPVYKLNKLPESSPLQHPIAISVSGDFRHTQSKYQFPSENAGFQRSALIQYDNAGLHISAGYNGGSTQCPTALTIYVYPTPRMSLIGASPEVVRSLDADWLDVAYLQSKQEISVAHQNALLQKEDSRTQDGVPGKKALYLIGDRSSELFVFVVDHTWYLKYRISYLAACTEKAHSAIQKFFSMWKGRAS